MQPTVGGIKQCCDQSVRLASAACPQLKNDAFQSCVYYSKKHLKNVGPIRHCEPRNASLPFTRCRYCRVARRLRIDVYNDDDDDNDNA